MNISLLGLDIAKNIFQLHGVDSAGKKVLKQRIERNKALRSVPTTLAG
jgi:transposase